MESGLLPLEIIMDTKVRAFLYQHQILSCHQFGFIKDKSTAEAIVNFVHDIYKAFETREYVTGLLFDMSKAFDLVDHKILFKKLEAHGIRGIVLEWFKSYLKDRKQLVEINHIAGENCKQYRSFLCNVMYGVPQGSTLGPLLFIIFINDLCAFLKAGKLVNFADDTNVLVCSKTLSEHEELLDQAINEMKEWCYLNNLVLNASKTNVIQFRTNERVQLNLNSKFSDLYVNHAKFLGINLDQHLRWDTHLQDLKLKLSKCIFGIRRIKNIVDQQTALLTYYGMVHSQISYCTLLWGNSTHMAEIFRTQKKCIRAVFSLKQQESCKHYFTEFKIMTAYSIYIQQLLNFVKKHENTFVKSKDVHQHSTRQNSLIYNKCVHLTVSEKDVLYIGPKLYNMLPSNIRQLSFKKFKTTIKKKLLECAFYSLSEYYEEGLNFRHFKNIS